MARTDIISIELVHPYECTGSREPEDPGEERAQDGELAFVQVVGEGRVELVQSKRSKFSQHDYNALTEETEPNNGRMCRASAPDPAHSPRYANGRPS